ncbi:MAG: hypothetical protein WC813_02410 [Patescibacteria group bacterium]|jgi:hypothetical protein
MVKRLLLFTKNIFRKIWYYTLGFLKSCGTIIAKVFYLLCKVALPYGLLLAFTISLIVALFKVQFGVETILFVIDEYLKIILTSWSASILFIALIILWRHHDAIDHFIKNRMTHVGSDGINAAVVESSATDAEAKKKTIQEMIETEPKTKKVEVSSKTSANALSNKQDAATLDQKNVDRYEKASRIETILQTRLIERYGEKYKSQVKLTMEGKKDLILDGLLYSKKLGKPTAIEIRYFTSKNYEALRFILARFKEKLAIFGIKRLVVIVVGDRLEQEDAVKLQDQNLNLAKLFFYKRNDGGDLEEVLIPERLERLF